MMTVIKLGGRAQADARLVQRVAALWNRRPGTICIVHGGGDDVSALQRQLGREPVFVNGRRVTTNEDLDLVRMVLSGTANKRLVAALTSAGLPAVGISGEDGGLLPAEPIDPALFGRAGKPTRSDPAVLTTLLQGGFLPVVSPVGRDITSDSGAALNVNGDDAAAAIASSLEADLWMISDVEGVLDGGVVRCDLDAETTNAMITAGTVSQGMHAKLEAGFAALRGGCPSVRIAGIEAITDSSAGTFLSLTPSYK